MDTPAFQEMRILVAEDNQVSARVITARLEAEGFEVVLARDGEQCLHIAQTVKPDLILLDLMMPKLSGLDVLKQLKANVETRNIEVVICSAKGFKTEVDQAMELGACGFLDKPVHKQDLLPILARVLHAEVEASPHTQTPAPEAVFDPQLLVKNGLFHLWGTRGSIPISGSRFIRYGGNTSCLEVTRNSDRVIFDAGSGIRDLGLSFMAGEPCQIHLFVTHTHWDHIQGFPFFTPAFVPGYDITVYAAHNVEKDLESIFRGQLDRAYFPVQLEDMQASLKFQNLSETPVHIGDMKITWEYALHPSPTVGYKIEINGKTLVYIPDNEFLKGYVGSPHTITRNDERVHIHDPLIRFLTDVDVVIHEAQYIPQEYPQKIGWGHTSISNGSLLMKFANARKWIVTHHDPLHDDDTLQDKLNLTRQILRDLDCDIDVQHAYDGMVEYF